MTSFDDFADLSLFLQQAASDDPLLALSSAYAWLDPLAVPAILNDVEEEALAECEMSRAVLVLRDCFPETYIRVIGTVRHHHTWQSVQHLIISAVNQHILGPGIQTIEELGFYIPYESTAVALFDTTFDSYKDSFKQLVQDILGWFKVTYDAETGSLDECHYWEAGTAAEVLAISLRGLDNQHAADLAMLLEWVFSRTGNTLADCTDEELADSGLPYPEWSCSDIELHNEVQAEAYAIVEQAERGYQMITSCPDLIQCVIKNAQKTLAAVKKWQEGQAYHEFQRYAPGLAAGCEWAKFPPDDDECHSATDASLL